MLKNYNVKIRNLNKDRVSVFVKYLNDTKHKNHSKHNTKIYNLSNTDLFIEKSNEKIRLNEEKFIKRARGGRRLKVFAKSLTFNIPKSFIVNELICQKVYNDLMKQIIDLYKVYDYRINQSDFYSVLHLQPNSHFHIVLPYLDNSGNTLKFSTRKQFLNELKLIWNNVVETQFKVSKEDYIPLSVEQEGNNKTIRYLHELLSFYSNYKEDKYIKNQIVVINRLLADNKEIEQDKIQRVEKNKLKVVKNLKKNNINLGKIPKL